MNEQQVKRAITRRRLERIHDAAGRLAELATILRGWNIEKDDLIAAVADDLHSMIRESEK